MCNKAQSESFVFDRFFYSFFYSFFLSVHFIRFSIRSFYPFILFVRLVRSFCSFIPYLRALAFAQKKSCQCRDISSRQNKQRHVVRNPAKLRLPPYGFRGIGRGLGIHIYLHQSLYFLLLEHKCCTQYLAGDTNNIRFPALHLEDSGSSLVFAYALSIYGWKIVPTPPLLMPVD
jgi:hypothetical protein